MYFVCLLHIGLFSSSPKQCSQQLHQQQPQQQQQQQNDIHSMQFLEPLDMQKNHNDEIFSNR